MNNPRIKHFESVDSTNKLALEKREEGVVYWADMQTAGRGQHGKRWESAAQKGLWFTYCCSGTPRGLQFAAALAVYNVLSKYASVKLKWPNDLLLNAKKCCGILVEHVENWNALGIGINVLHTPEDFPEEIRPIATSLATECDRQWERESLLDEMVQSLDHQLSRLRGGNYADVFKEWKNACDIVGRIIEREGVRGKVIALEEDGALQVETDTGIIRIDSGVVAVVEES